MRKLIVLILISLFVTGCNIKDMDTSNLDKTINTIMKNGNKLSNISVGGYKYYLPKGVRVSDSNNYNEKLYCRGNTYYLYVDVLSYYYKKKGDYAVNPKAYFSKQLNGGYVEINKIKDNYFIEMMYNYAKIETYVSKSDVPDTVMNLSYVLASIKYNNIVIKKLFDENATQFSESVYNIFKVKGKQTGSLDIYTDDYSDNQLQDEDIITSNPNMMEE